MTKTAEMVLAFDSSCSTCRAISDRVSAASGGKLVTRGLSDPQVVQWRTEALGEDAEETPTLISVGAEADRARPIRAWTGAGMLVPLVRHLGVRDAMAVTRSLGALRQEWADLERGREQQRSLSRRSVFQLGAGAAAAAGMMAVGRAPAMAMPSANPKVLKSRTVTGKALADNVGQVLEHVDVKNLVPAADLKQLRAAPLQTSKINGQSMIKLSPNGTTTLAASDVRSGTLRPVSQATHEIEGGVQSRVTSVAIGENRLVVLEEYSPAYLGQRSNAFVVDLDIAGGQAIYRSYSTNGHPDVTIGRALTDDQLRKDCTDGYPKDDPCGGCCLNGDGAILVDRCKASGIYKCAAAAASCAACSAACAESFGLACGACLFAACPTAVKACCSEKGEACSTNACL